METLQEKSAEFHRVRGEIFKLHGQGRYREALELALVLQKRFHDKAAQAYFWRACLHSRLNESDKAVEILKEAMRQGHWYSDQLVTDEDLAPLQEREDFRKILEESRKLAGEARQKPGKPEVLVLTPHQYSPKKSWPLLVVLHGRAGRADDFTPYWESCLSKGWLLAALQSSQPYDSSTFCWDDRKRSDEDLAWAYEKIRLSHSVDTEHIVLGGYSQGAWRAMSVALQGHMPAKGFVAVALAVPKVAVEGPPQAFPSAGKMKGWIFQGEKDSFFLELVKTYHQRINDGGVRCDLSVDPLLGHDFPEDFDSRLARCLEFIAD